MKKNPKIHNEKGPQPHHENTVIVRLLLLVGTNLSHVKVLQNATNRNLGRDLRKNQFVLALAPRPKKNSRKETCCSQSRQLAVLPKHRLPKQWKSIKPVWQFRYLLFSNLATKRKSDTGLPPAPKKERSRSRSPAVNKESVNKKPPVILQQLQKQVQFLRQ